MLKNLIMCFNDLFMWLLYLCLCLTLVNLRHAFFYFFLWMCLWNNHLCLFLTLVNLKHALFFYDFFNLIPWHCLVIPCCLNCLLMMWSLLFMPFWSCKLVLLFLFYFLGSWGHWLMIPKIEFITIKGNCLILFVN